MRNSRVSLEEMKKEIETNPEMVMEPDLIKQVEPNIYQAIIYMQKRANEIGFLEYEFVRHKIEECESRNPDLVQESLVEPVYDQERIEFFKEFRKRMSPVHRAILEFLEGKLVCKNLRKG